MRPCPRELGSVASRSSIPPIVVERLPNWPTHFKTLKQRLGHPPNASPFKEGIRFLAKTDAEFRVVQRYLIECSATETIHWHCYTLESEKPSKILIRGLPKDTSIEDIKESLTEKGLTVLSARMIPSMRGRQGCVYHVTLAKMSDIELQKLYSLTELMDMQNLTIEG